MHAADFSARQDQKMRLIGKTARLSRLSVLHFYSRAAFPSIGRVNASMTYNSSSQCMAHTRPRLLTFTESHLSRLRVVYKHRDGPRMD